MAEKKEKRYVSDNAQLMTEWNWDKNQGLNPHTITWKSDKKVWWKCSKGHEWLATINSRKGGIGCPYCSGRKVLAGYNDLQTVSPSLAEEWNYEKNNELSPADVTQNSNKRVWWKCSEGHEWEATINNRSKGNRCPICRRNKK